MRANRILGVVGLGLSVIYLVATIRLPAAGLTDAIGPKAFPLLVGILGSIVSLVLLLQRRKGSNEVIVSVGSKHIRYIAVIVLICIVYALLFEILGFLISSFMFLYAILFLLNKGRWLQNIFIAVAFAASFYFIFFGLLGISLPRGILSF